uniref:HYR domain-containing protein n=1 Tax=Chromera velia CCMP2878 TaxID=1169474 RepID=A0A0G4F642_9ALVE|eukprot:Cvel_15217.t1-p1 / transcript=Cvel_15217.t1 / gene=Cvel_15217 / organism=Chromera_velia_CCMP2878 / gene_product=Probable E3 ubiquitin-protein ligase HERC3, putative / transcript_product=Probable E3 ubiquitin-protein ligase HERC3, putative / location=Cvel_scaffold1113:20240-35195(-) / protein_length=2803 / sequence_SO=supercontig / SO=protein_coding / is_pseudo=false
MLSETCDVPVEFSSLNVSGLHPLLSRSSDGPLSVGFVAQRLDLQCPQGLVCSYRLGEGGRWRGGGECFTEMQCLGGQLVVAAGSRYLTCAAHPHDTLRTAFDLSDRFSPALKGRAETTSVEGVWLGATGDPDFADCGGSSDSFPGVWFSLSVPPSSGPVAVSLYTLAKAVIGVLSGTGCPSDSSACECKGSANYRELPFASLERGGSELYVLVRPYEWEDRGNFNLTVALSAPHSHDTLETAFHLSNRFSPALTEGMETTSVEGNWERATGDGEFGECGGSASRPGVWYRLRLPESNGRLLAVSVDTCTGTSVNTIIGVLSGAGCPSDSSVCQCEGWDGGVWDFKNSCGNGRSRVSFVERGSSEVFVVVGQRGDGSSFNLTVTVERPEVGSPSLVAQGGEHSLMGDNRGDLFVFGSNRDGQLGLEDIGNFRLPTRVPSLSDVVDVCGGSDFSLLLLGNGTVLSSGSNRYYGQLGRGSGWVWGDWSDWRPLPVEGLEGESVVGVACGGSHSAAWTEEGNLFMWGRGEDGQLGLGDRETRHNASLVSAAVLEGEAVTQVALGRMHTLIACRSGRLFSWGKNDAGQVGNGRSGDLEREASPVEVFVGTGGERVVAVAAGADHSLILTSSGKVLGFGDNEYGQLGLGSSEDIFSTPQWVEKLPEGVVEIAAGGSHSFVRVKDGRVFSFGKNENGELGLGHTTTQREPREVEGVRVERLWKGGYRSLSSLLITGGGVVGAGRNEEGQLGLGGGEGLSHRDKLSFVSLLDESGIAPLDLDECAVMAEGHCDARAICRDTVGSFVCECPQGTSSSGDGTLCVGSPSLVAQGGKHSLMVDNRGDLFVFGSNRDGQLGLEDIGNFRLPTRVPSLSDVVDVCGGGGHAFSFSLVLLGNGTVVSFGDNSFGQLGRGSGWVWGDWSDWRPLPVEGLEGERVVGVACGGSHSAAWTEEGNLFMWGRGEHGQLGLGDRETRRNASLVSAAVLEGEAVTQVALGGSHTLIACRSGRLFSWGWNFLGQLGDGRRGERETKPVEVFVGTGGERVVAVAAGQTHSLVLTSSGKVFRFGSNIGGTLGSFSSTPQPLEKLPGGAVEIAAGVSHLVVRVGDGRVFYLGRSNNDGIYGQTTTQREPREVEGVRVERLWKGGSGSLSSLLITGGGVVGAGRNEEGQLGLGEGGGLTGRDFSLVPLLMTTQCPSPAIHFQNDRGASFWRSSRASFARFFPFPFSSLDREGEGDLQGNSASRIHIKFSPPVEPRLFDVGKPEKIRVRLIDSLSRENEGTCEFTVGIIDREPPQMTCASPVPLKISRETPVLSLADPTVSDNVDLPDDVRLSFRTPNGSELQRHFSSEETLNVLVEGTDKAGNTGNCTIVVTADRCPSNADRMTVDSPCLCMENFYRSPPEEGFVCRPCDSNSQSKRGSTSSFDCLCNEGFYRDPSVPDASVCRQCILNSHSQRGATLPSQCGCVERFYFSPPETKNSEGEPIVSLVEIISHWHKVNKPLALFTSGTCEPCPPNSICSGQLLTDTQVSQVLKQSRLPKALTSREADRRWELCSDGSCGTELQHLSPLRLLEAQSLDSSQQTLKQLMAHPRPVPHGNFSLVQRWPRAVVVPCPFDGTCTSVEPGHEDLADAVSSVQRHFQDETAGTVCEEGHEGPLCSECKTGRHLLRRGTEIRCRECPDASRTIVAGVGLFLLAVALVVGYTGLVTKDNPRKDVPDFAIAAKILTVFLTALGFLANLARPAFIVFREELAERGLGVGGGEGRSSGGNPMEGGAVFLATTAQEFLDFLRSLPTIGELFSIKCLMDLLDWSTGENEAGREMLALLVPLGVVGLIGSVGLVVVLSSYCTGAKGKGEGRESRDGEQTRSTIALPPTRRNTVGMVTVPPEADAPSALPDNLGGGAGAVGAAAGPSRGANLSPLEMRSAGTVSVSPSFSDSFEWVRERFCMRLSYNRRVLGVFRWTFDRETSIWVRLLSLHQDMTPVILSTVFLWAPSIVSAPLASLRCEPLHPDLSERRLHTFPSIVCSPTVRAYTRWQGWSVGVLLAGVIGVPVWNESTRYTILNFHAVLFLLLQTLLWPYRSAALNWLETFSLIVWFCGVVILRVVTDRAILLEVRVALVLLLFLLILSFGAVCGGFIVVRFLLENVLRKRQRKGEEGQVWTCLPVPEVPWWKRVWGGIWRWVLGSFRCCRCCDGDSGQKGPSCCNCRRVGASLYRLLLLPFSFCLSVAACCCRQLRALKCCRWCMCREELRFCLQEGGHALVTMRQPSSRLAAAGGGKVGTGEMNRNRRVKGEDLVIPREPLLPSDGALFEKCEKIIDTQARRVNARLNKARQAGLGGVEGVGRTNGKDCGEALSSTPADLRLLPFIASFSFRMICLSRASMSQGSRRENNEKRFIASSCDETAEHCAIVRELLRVPHPVAPPISGDSSHDRPGQPIIPFPGLQPPAEEGGEQSVRAFGGVQPAGEGAGGKAEGREVALIDGFSPSPSPPRADSEGAAEPASASLPVAAAVEEGEGGRESEYQSEREASLSLNSLPLSDDPSLLEFAERRMRVAHAVGEHPHESRDAVASAGVGAAPSVPASVTGEAAPQGPSAVPALSEPVHQRKGKETEEKGEERKENKSTQTKEEKVRFIGGHTLSGNLLRKRRGEQQEEPSAAAVGDSQGQRGGGSSNCGWGEDDQILHQRQRQWTEEDAETADGALTDRLIAFHQDGTTERQQGALVDSLEEWLREGASEKERRCFWRMSAVGRAFFDSPSIERALRDEGIPQREFKEGVELFLHLHPAQVLQLYQCFLAAACTSFSSSSGLRRSD